MGRGGYRILRDSVRADLQAIPKFRALFVGFGADLPDGTGLLPDRPYLVWVFPVLALLLSCVALTAPAEKAIAWHRRMVAALAVLCVLPMVAQGLAVVALYAPIFFMGAVV